jgi:hypothetical protein
MRDYDDETVEVWVAADTTSDDHAEAAAEDIQRNMIRDRMLGMWRSAVAAVGEVVKAEHERQAEDEPKPAKWSLPAWNAAN